MEVRHFEAFHDCRAARACELFKVIDAINPRSAHGGESLDNVCYFVVAGCLRNNLLSHVIKRNRELLNVSRDVRENLTDSISGQIHSVAFPYEMGWESEIKFVPL